MSDELDDEELQGLLDELDEREEDIVESTLPPEEPEPEPKVEADEEEPDPLDDAEDINDEEEGVAMRPVDIRKMGAQDNPLSQPEPVEPEQQQLPIEVENYKKQLETVTKEVLDACRSDRQEAQDVINDLRQRLQATSGAKGPPPKALVDGLVQAVQVKAGINTNAIKIMDTNARFLASIKPSIKTQNNLNVGSSEDLRRILESPVDEA